MSDYRDIINGDLLSIKKKTAKLLVIDNDSPIYTDLQQLLQKLCCSLHTAKDGRTGLSMIQELKPDIIFLNMNLPDIKGMELLAQFKSNAAMISRFVIIDHSNATYSLQDIISWGICDYIELPHSLPKLELQLKNILLLKTYEEIAIGECLDIKLEKQKAENERNLLSKYFSKDLAEGILKGDISTAPGGKVTIASILFCDLRNSTGIAESIDPEVFWDFLNNLFTDITDIIYGEQGSVNKFLGNGILATFGCPKPLEQDALHSARVAIKIRKYLKNFNQFKPKHLAGPIELGVGLARGKLFTGNLGSVNQIEYTVLGDPVNTASRLESLTKYGNVDILIDGNICNELGDKADVKRVNLTSIRGKHKEVDVFYLKDLTGL
ncbi:MAG: response regulator [Spirochaetales bacterium]|nr:response regulator [Spirochaetales bacterium]